MIGKFESLQVIGKVHKYALPIVSDFLSIEFCAGVPRAVISVEQPAPICIEWQQNPHWFTHGASQVCHAGVNTDHNVDKFAKCCGVGEVIYFTLVVQDFRVQLQRFSVLVSEFFLQTDILEIIRQEVDKD